MMKKVILIFSLFIPFIFQSCVDKDYDLDDEKVDPNVVFSPGGINLPIGDIDTIYVAEQLQKEYNGGENTRIETDPSGLLYLEYDGNFDFSWQYDLNEMTPMVAASNLVADIEGIPLLNATIPLPAGKEISLINPGNKDYNVSNVHLIDQGELTIIPKKIKFNQFEIKLDIALQQISFANAGPDAELELQVTFPDGFTLEEGKNIIRTIPVSEMSNGSASFPAAKVLEYDYSVEDSKLTYNLLLKTGSSPLDVTVSSDPQFELTLDVDNINLADLECVLDGSKSFSGIIENFNQLNSSFGIKGDTLEFIKPYLDVDLQTNLESDFQVDINVFNDDEQATVSNLIHKKDQENNRYILSEEAKVTIAGKESVDFQNLNTVISVLPEQLKYDIILRFDQATTTLKPSQELNLDVNYLLNLPFNFSKVCINFADELDLGDDFYTDLFEYATGNVSIEADVVNLLVEEGEANENLNIAIDIAFLDAAHKEIEALKSSEKILDQTRTPNLRITIPESKIKEMENARYLQFKFTLRGEGEIDLTERDFISIETVRIVSDNGIHFEF